VLTGNVLIPADAGYYAVFRYRLGYHGLPLGPVTAAVASLLALAFALFAMVILLFPDGRLTSRRWRWMLWGYVGLVCYVGAINLGPAVAADASHDIRVNSSGDVTDTAHLTGWLAHPPGWLTAVVYLSIGVIWLSWWPPPRWPRRRCSAPCGAGCSARWTGGSTGPATTPTRW